MKGVEEITTTRAGDVLVNGVKVGSVIKVTKDTSFMWKAVDANGMPLARWQEKKRDAVNIVATCSKPAEVKGMCWERALTGRMVVTASLTVKGHRMMVSRYPDESDWFVDMAINRGGFCPAFANGTGCRPERILGDAEGVKALASEATRLDIWKH
jgi:hypothetical protein